MGSIPQTGIGTRVYINATLPSANTLAGFVALTGWTEIGEINAAPGEMKWSNAAVTLSRLASGRTETLKGMESASPIAFAVNYVTGDAGIIIVQSAKASPNNYSIRVVTQDLTTYYFYGRVTEFGINSGSESGVQTGTFSVAPNSDFWEGAGTGMFKVTFALAGSTAGGAKIIGSTVQYVASGGSSEWVYVALGTSTAVAWSPTPGGGGASAVAVRATSVSSNLSYVGTIT